MKCIPCLQGMPDLCMTGGNCDSGNESAQSETSNANELSSVRMSDGVYTEEDYERKPPRIRKRSATLKDPLSTGRKEAARLYPLYEDRDCEWAYSEKAGGGKHPIKGCAVRFGVPNKQVNRHHGPDKDTMNNDEGNVHRICSHCHNKWHAANDDDYDPDNVKDD
jgi:hypothetical protein